MPAPRKAMRKIKDVLRLKYEAGLPHERIAPTCGVAKGALATYVERAQAARLSWPLPANLGDRVADAVPVHCRTAATLCSSSHTQPA